jgi:glycerophosphoryl diester phosphodiesterase
MVGEKTSRHTTSSANRASTNRRTFLAGTAGALTAGALSNTAAANGETKPDGVEQSEENERERDEPLLIAHRAFAGLYPENTVSAAEYASHSGEEGWLGQRRPEWIEIDIAPTADGDIAVMHDDPLCDLTDVDGGYVFQEPSDVVFNAEVLRSGETVPLLEEVMAVIPADIGVNIDAKDGSEDVTHGPVSDPKDEYEEWGWLKDAYDIATGYDNELLVSTFWEGALAATREIIPDVPAAFLFWESIEEGLEITERYDCEAVHPPLTMLLNTPFFASEDHAYKQWVPAEFEEIDLITEAHEADREVNVWTINTWYEAEVLIDAGVDGLIADYDGVMEWGARERR